MVENINSILRPYLNNSKNQITQEFLNLFAFYHNHRRFTAGKRKGKKQKKDWLMLLMDYIEEFKPILFLQHHSQKTTKISSRILMNQRK